MKDELLKKINQEILKNINKLINTTSDSSIGELYYFISTLHFVRIQSFLKNIDGGKLIQVHQAEDNIKYAIPLIFKHAKKKIISKEMTTELVNGNLIQYIFNTIKIINEKFEGITFIQLFNDIQTEGENNRFVKIYLDEMNSNQEIKMITEY